jgi:hypothetical protein
LYENGRQRFDFTEGGIALTDVETRWTNQGIRLGLVVMGQRQEEFLFQQLITHHAEQGGLLWHPVGSGDETLGDPVVEGLLATEEEPIDGFKGYLISTHLFGNLQGE